MKTKIISLVYYCLAGVVLLMPNACYKNIHLEPDGLITEGAVFSSLANYEKALTAVYIRLNDGTHLQWLDGVSDDGLVTHEWNAGYHLGRGTASSFEGFSSSRWSSGYVSVQRANNLVCNIDRFAWPGGAANPDRTRVLAEARTLRAYFYLNLVSYFGRIQFYETNPTDVQASKGIPQVQDPKVVFDYVLKELEAAISDLPVVAVNKSKLNKDAARLLRARAAAYAAGYLSDKAYFAITLAETAELMKTIPELGSYPALFTSGNESLDEVILVRTYSIDQRNGWGSWYNNSIGGYCVTTPIKALVDAYEYIAPPVLHQPYTNKDPRFDASIYAPGSMLRQKYYNTIPFNTVEEGGKTYFDSKKDYGNLNDKEVWVGDVKGEPGGGEWNKTPTGFSYKKYFTALTTWSTYNSFVMFRYAEALLLRAEALAELGGQDAEAKELIRKIRARAGNTNDMDKMIATQYGTLLELIRNERRVELAQEGLRLFDIRRWKLVEKNMSKPAEGISFRKLKGGVLTDTTYQVVSVRKFSARDAWWPIPQTEIDLNKGRITQNKDW